MSNQEMILGERRCEGHELPPGLSQDMSEEGLKSIFSDYGWVYLSKVTNKSSHKIEYYNPYLDRSGEIQPGDSESSSCTGYIPLWSHSRRYEITYYTKAFDEWKMLKVKDLDGDWLVSFEHDGVDEDIRAFHPKFLKTFINLIIKDTGYEVYSPDWNCTLAALSFQHRK